MNSHQPLRVSRFAFRPRTRRRSRPRTGPADHLYFVSRVSTGFLTNISNLLKSGPDKYSSLNGVDLVNQKVSYAAIMGGVYPQSSVPAFNFAEFNYTNDPTATLEVVSNFPRPLVFDGFEIGVNILTGSTLVDPQTNPVALAYQLYVGAGNNRNSWDPSCVFTAVRGLAGVWKAQTGGSLTITAPKRMICG